MDSQTKYITCLGKKCPEELKKVVKRLQERKNKISAKGLSPDESLKKLEDALTPKNIKARKAKMGACAKASCMKQLDAVIKDSRELVSVIKKELAKLPKDVTSRKRVTKK
jgi:hypothetical protein